MVPTSTGMRLATCLTVASTKRLPLLVGDVRNSPVVPRMMMPGTPSASCQSRKRRQAGRSIALPSSVKGVIVTV